MSDEPIVVGKLELRRRGDGFWNINSEIEDVHVHLPIALWSDWLLLARKILEREEGR